MMGLLNEGGSLTLLPAGFESRKQNNDREKQARLAAERRAAPHQTDVNKPQLVIWGGTAERDPPSPRRPPPERRRTMPAMYLTLLAVALGAAASPLSTPHDIPRERSMFTLAPLLVEEHPHGTVNSSYIVMLKPQTGAEVMQNHMNFVQLAHAESGFAAVDGVDGLKHVYDGHVKGYAGMFDETVIDRIRQLPEVAYVEKDQIVRTLEVEPLLDTPKTQGNAPWVRKALASRLRVDINYTF
jgi:hypothetical protein